MTVNHDVVSSSLTGAARKEHTREGVFFFGFFYYFKLIIALLVVMCLPTERSEVGGGRLRAPPVADEASKKACAAVETVRARARKQRFGHRKRKHDGWFGSNVGSSRSPFLTKRHLHKPLMML